SAVVVRGAAGSLGFLRLPLFASGPDPALRVALRRSVPGQPLEALALVSTEPAMSALADTQRFSFGAMAFLLVGLAALWLWMGQDAPALRAQVQEDTEPGTRRRRGLFGLSTSPPPVFRAPDTNTRPPERVTPAPRARTAIALDEPPPRAVDPPPPPPEARTHDEPEPFADGLPAPRASREPPRDDLAALLDSMPPPPQPVRPPSQRVSPSPATPPRPVAPKPAPPPEPAPLDYDHQPTTAYPIPNLPDFNLPPASALGPAANAIPEATRVADVSPDLLASTR